MPNTLTPELEAVLSTTVQHWFRNAGGTSAFDVERELEIDHATAMLALEKLAYGGHGSLKRNVKMGQITIDLEHPGSAMKMESETTHIFFPSKANLHKAFYSSDLPQKGLPEYQTRLHLGAHQIGMVWFSEEVLSRYLKRPEHYSTEDTLAGGQITARAAAPNDLYIYVRYGKSRLTTGQIAVTAIYKDLASMSPAEQHHWRAHEITAASPDSSDEHFQKFLARTYDGDFVEYEDPISSIEESIAIINASFGDVPLMKRAENVHLHMPAEQTYKAYCDSASELYKIIGPDNLSAAAMKSVLIERFGLSNADFQHRESKRPVSNLQLLSLLEDVVGVSGLVSKPIRDIGELRVDADHRILGPDSETRSYSREFARRCSKLADAIGEMAIRLAGHRCDV